ncbi:MAG: MFS transporter, partial [Thermoproteota archaeon]
SMVACVLVYFATNIFTALSLYVLMGLSMAFFTPIISALIFEVVEPSRAPVSFALFYLVTLIGASLSSLISGWLSKSFASELPFLVASILFLTSIPIYFVHTGKRSKKGNGWSALTNLIDIKAMLFMLKQNPYLGFYGFSLLFHELGFFMINPYINLFAQQFVGLDMLGLG